MPMGGRTSPGCTWTPPGAIHLSSPEGTPLAVTGLQGGMKLKVIPPRVTGLPAKELEISSGAIASYLSDGAVSP